MASGGQRERENEEDELELQPRSDAAEEMTMMK